MTLNSKVFVSDISFTIEAKQALTTTLQTRHK